MRGHFCERLRVRYIKCHRTDVFFSGKCWRSTDPGQRNAHLDVFRLFFRLVCRSWTFQHEMLLAEKRSNRKKRSSVPKNTQFWRQLWLKLRLHDGVIPIPIVGGGGEVASLSSRGTVEKSSKKHRKNSCVLWFSTNSLWFLLFPSFFTVPFKWPLNSSTMPSKKTLRAHLSLLIPFAIFDIIKESRPSEV